MQADATVQDVALVQQAIGLRSQTAEAALERLRAADRRLDIEQQAEVRRSTSAANTAELLAQGKRAFMLGLAAALVILAAGIAVRLTQRSPAAPLATVEPAAVPARPDIPLPLERDDIIVSDYVTFTKTTRTIGGIEYVIQAGHLYLDERAETFDSAWCYTEVTVGGVRMSLRLGTLAPSETPAPVPDTLTRDALGLTEAQAEELFRACPWLAPKQPPLRDRERTPSAATSPPRAWRG